MFVLILVAILILIAVGDFMERVDTKKWMTDLMVTAFVVYLFVYSFILAFLGKAITRLVKVTENTPVQPCRKQLVLVVVTFATNLICFIVYSWQFEFVHGIEG